MAGSRQEAQQERHLRVVYTPGKPSLLGRAEGIAQRAILEAVHHTERPPQAGGPQYIDIPGKHVFGISRYKNLAPGRGRVVADAMGELAGAGVNYRDFSVIDVKNGNERELKRRLGPFGVGGGWEKGIGLRNSVKKAHEANLREARHNLKAETASFSRKKDPIQAALDVDSEEQKRLKKAQGRRKYFKFFPKINFYEWRASLVARLAERDPLRAGRKAFEIGRTPEQIFNEAYSFLVRYADNKPDPDRMIGGPFEKAIRRIQELQQSEFGVVVTTYFGGGRFFDKLTDVMNWMTTGNKIASRDVIRHPLLTARNLGVQTLYQLMVYEKAEKHWLGRLLFPPPPLVEKAADRAMERGDVAREAKLRAILSSPNLSNPIESRHQRIVAEEFIRAYQADAPRLDVFIDTIVDGTVGAINTVTDPVRKFVAESNLIPDFVKDKIPPPSYDSPKSIVEEANEAYGIDPKPVKEQVDAILDYADLVLESGELSNVERVRWEIARDAAERLDYNYQLAVGIAGLEYQTEEPITPVTPMAPVDPLVEEQELVGAVR